MSISRRDVTMGLGGIAAIGMAAWTWFGMKSYPATPFDDLLDQIVDRRYAATLGKDMPKPNITALTEKLRQPGFALRRRAREDAAAGRVVDVKGWMVPETVALYANLAAQF